MRLPDDWGYEEENGNGKLVRGRSEEDVCEWAENLKILMSHCKAGSHYSGGQDDPSWGCQPASFFGQSSAYSIGSWTKWLRQQVWRYAWAQQNGLSLTNTDLATATAECPTSPKHKPVLSFQYGTMSLRNQLGLIILDLFHWGMNNVLSSKG